MVPYKPDAVSALHRTHDLLSYERHVIEIREVEHLQVDAGNAHRGIRLQNGDHLVWSAGCTVRPELGGLPTYRGGPTLDLRLVRAAAQHERRRAAQRGRISPDMRARLVGEPVQPRAGPDRRERDVELVRVPRSQCWGATWSVTTDDDGWPGSLHGLRKGRARLELIVLALEGVCLAGDRPP